MICRPLIVAFGFVIASGCSCATAGALDAASADAGRDVAWIFWDTSTDANLDMGICSPQPIVCGTDDDCLRWGAFVGPAGTWPVTTCSQNFCTIGATSCHHGTATTTCLCTSSSVCADGEVCVSDTQGGEARCTQACQGR